MRYLNYIVLVSAATLAAYFVGTRDSDGSNGTVSGHDQMGASATLSPFASAGPSLMNPVAASSNAAISASKIIYRGANGDSDIQSTGAAAARSSITGNPATRALVGSAYKFAPASIIASIRRGAFVIANCPSWATFNPDDGSLSGTPAAKDVGTYSGIAISALVDGGRTETLPSFSIAVTELAAGSATLSWEAPQQKTDGTEVTDLAGFRIYYGTDPDSLDQSVDVRGTSLSTYTVRNLLPGTWYFEVQAYSGSIDGSTSNILTKEVM